jgi:teichuronic acid biosynthesis glycosyltransferase TuaG
MNLVSVVMPYFRKKAFIKQSIKSVLSQTYKNLEILIVYDDKDLTDYNYINKLKELDHRIIVLKNSKNLGAGLSRNFGIKRSRGHYIAFLDCDDLWDKNKLDRQINYMLKKNISFSFTSYKIIDEKNNIIGLRDADATITYKDLLHSCDIGLSTVILKKKLIKRNCQFPHIKTKEDYVLWLKLSKKLTLYGLNEYLTSWRKLKNSLSSNFFQKIIDGFRVYKYYLNYSYPKSFVRLLILSCNYIKKII